MYVKLELIGGNVVGVYFVGDGGTLNGGGVIVYSNVSVTV